jgi:hydroxymethylpyrimidine/phosphomethylpyrimidine kinase
MSEKVELARYVLTISASDSSGMAGMQMDNRALSALGVMPVNVLTAITLQAFNQGMYAQIFDAKLVRLQLSRMLEAFPIAAIKIGSLGNAQVVHAVADVLAVHATLPIVLDPVYLSTSGAFLLDASGLALLNQRLLPLATLVTPNQLEVQKLDLDLAAAVLLKGGHSHGDLSVDRLVYRDGRSFEFSAPRVDTRNSRGTGCALSSLIAGYLALGRDLPAAVEAAKSCLTESLLRNVTLNCLGPGPSFY